MRTSIINRIRKGIAVGLVIGTTMISTVVPVLANEPQQPQISPWSIGTLNEGEKYGIYPMAWYIDKFQESIPEDKIVTLLDNVAQKLLELELEKDETFSPQVYVEDGTRGAILAGLYNQLACYQLPEELGFNDDPVVYMQQRGILNGTDQGLALEEACTVEQATVFATRLIEDTYRAAQVGAKGLMWQVSKGENTLYLLGSIHIGDTSLYPLSEQVRDAFNQSDMLIVEANILGGQEGLDEFIQAAMYSDGSILPEHVSEETYEKCVQVLGQYGLPVNAYDEFKPWCVANDLSVIVSSNSDSLQGGAEAATLGIDRYFLTIAMLTGKPVAELEGIMYQAELFNSLSPEMQEEYLNSVLDEVLNPESSEGSKSAALLKLWTEQWYQGDIEGFTSSYSDAIGEEKGEFEQMLFGKRDQDMAKKLIQLLEKDGKTTYFVVIGAGHLVEEDTVIDQLKEKGYVVEVVE
ncbi:MAG TPA: TraB/GumN family protein [Epulopiscium sp.]|nr:TraB/GumN family protein [Candidatus Epulonipiscium sp.]